MRIIALTALIMLGAMAAPMHGQGMKQAPIVAPKGDPHALTEVEQLKLGKLDAEMQTMQLQFMQLKQAETQLQAAYASKQGELEAEKDGVFKRLNIEKGGLFQIVKEGKDWKVVAVEAKKDVKKESK